MTDPFEMDLTLTTRHWYWPFKKRRRTFHGAGTSWRDVETGDPATTSQAERLAELWLFLRHRQRGENYGEMPDFSGSNDSENDKE